MTEETLKEVLKMLKSGTHRNSIINVIENTLATIEKNERLYKKNNLVDFIPTTIQLTSKYTQKELDELVAEKKALVYTHNVMTQFYPLETLNQNLSIISKILEVFNGDQNKTVHFLYADYKNSNDEECFRTIMNIIKNNKKSDEEIIRMTEFYDDDNFIVNMN